MKIVNIFGENLHVFWTSWGISMKFLGKMWLIIILKITKNQGFILSLEDTFLENYKNGGAELTPNPSFTPSLLRVNTHYKNIVENASGYLESSMEILTAKIKISFKFLSRRSLNSEETTNQTNR